MEWNLSEVPNFNQIKNVSLARSSDHELAITSSFAMYTTKIWNRRGKMENMIRHAKDTKKVLYSLNSSWNAQLNDLSLTYMS